MKLFLQSNFIIPKEELISKFQVLLCWKELKFEDTTSCQSIENQFLWYNENIKRNNNVLVSDMLIGKGIISCIPTKNSLLTCQR